MKYNNGWPFLEISEKILGKTFKPPHDQPHLGYIYQHPFTSRLPITTDSFEGSEGATTPLLNGHTKSILTEVFAQNNVVWANFPTGLMKKLSFSEEDLRSIALSWTDAISQALDLKSMPPRTQGIHNIAEFRVFCTVG